MGGGAELDESGGRLFSRLIDARAESGPGGNVQSLAAQTSRYITTDEKNYLIGNCVGSGGRRDERQGGWQGLRAEWGGQARGAALRWGSGRQAGRAALR